ncbi:MAG: septum formation protein Maf [Chloroflexi bacterium]|nr:septum formation protein Maf [Chloroflexota bacterium]
MEKRNFLLASNSLRRREMLGWLGWEFTVCPADIDESPLPGEAPEPYVLRLAGSKALAALSNAEAHQTVLAADTIVADGDHLLGKPASAAEAAAMLRQLRGRSHTVCTAVAVIFPEDRASVRRAICVSQVPMRDYSEEEIEAYVASGDPLDKAGAYGIQHSGFHPVEGFAGCFASVMGLPLCHLLRLTGQAADPYAICKSKLGYDCPISAAVLRGEALG